MFPPWKNILLQNKSIRDKLMQVLDSFLPKTSSQLWLLAEDGAGKRCFLASAIGPHTHRGKKESRSRSLNLGSNRKLPKTSNSSSTRPRRTENRSSPSEQSDVSCSPFISSKLCCCKVSFPAPSPSAISPPLIVGRSRLFNAFMVF